MAPAVLQADRLELLNLKSSYLLERRLHTDFGSGRQFYDDELDMPAGVAHSHATQYLGDCLLRVANGLSLQLLVDNPVWYHNEERARQAPIFGDFGLLRNESPYRAIANDLALVLEVVSTSDIRKEHKDTVLRKDLNEKHRVPEFLLYYPDPDDDRSLFWWTFNRNGRCYSRLKPDINGYFYSRSVPGLSMCILPRSLWRGSRKVEVFFQDRLLETSEELEYKYEQTQQNVRQQSLRADAAEERALEAERRLEEMQRKYGS